MPSSPKGIRLNNPGNIERGEPWKGLAEVQGDPRFCTFTLPEFGIRAICKILRSYNTKYKITTIRGIINRWAPSHENPTEAYINNVANWSGIGANATIDFTSEDSLTSIIAGIIRQENGVQPYPMDTIKAGVKLGLK